MIRHLLILKETTHNLDFTQSIILILGESVVFDVIFFVSNADSVDGRNSSFDESNEFAVANCTICISGNSQRREYWGRKVCKMNPYLCLLASKPLHSMDRPIYLRSDRLVRAINLLLSLLRPPATISNICIYCICKRVRCIRF